MKVTIKATREVMDLAAEAYSAQNACNTCGLSHGFRNALVKLLTEDDNGTSYVNQHPVTVLWIDKFASLAHCQDLGNSRIRDAYAAIHRLMQGQDVEWEVVD